MYVDRLPKIDEYPDHYCVTSACKSTALLVTRKTVCDPTQKVIKIRILLHKNPVIKFFVTCKTVFSSDLNYYVISGNLCPVLDSQVQERGGVTGESPAKFC